ncbi:MAG: barstar family protein [Chloroflexota bacterium]
MKKLQLETNDITSRRQLRIALNDLVNFPGWNGSKLDDWLDLISLSDQKDPVFARFASSKPQQYSLEVNNSRNFLKNQPNEFDLLVTVIQRINKRYVERTNLPLFTVVFL